MKRLHPLFALPCLLITPVVIADDRPKSIMFDDSPDQRQLTSQPPRTTEQTDRCAALAREVEALKGRPQQRFTAAQRYEAECRR